MVTKNKTPAEVEAVTITMSRETAQVRGDGGSNLAKIQKSGRGNPGGNGETKGYCGDDTGFAKEEANAKKESGKRK